MEGKVAMPMPILKSFDIFKAHYLSEWNYNYQEDNAVTSSNPNNFKLLNLLIKFEQNFAPSEYLQSTAKLSKLLLASKLFFMQRYDYKLHYVPFIVKEVFDKVKVGLLSTTIHITLEKVGKVCTLSTPYSVKYDI